MCVDFVSKHYFSLQKLNLTENTHADLKRKSHKRHSKKKGYAAPLFAGIVAVAEPSEAFELATDYCSFNLKSMNSI